MVSNLPPGVSEGDIPGNRPEDEWWERFTEALSNDLPSYLYDSAPEKASQSIVEMLQAFEDLAADAFNLGRQEGKQDVWEEMAEKEMR